MAVFGPPFLDKLPQLRRMFFENGARLLMMRFFEDYSDVNKKDS